MTMESNDISVRDANKFTQLCVSAMLVALIAAAGILVKHNERVQANSPTLPAAGPTAVPSTSIQPR